MPPSDYRSAAEFESRVADVEEVSDADIHFSRLSGLAPADIDMLRDFSFRESLLIVIRCPKRPARYHHGHYPPKTLATSAAGHKTHAASGLVTLPDGRHQVSDYDLMCVYRYFGIDGYHKIPFSGVYAQRKTSPLPPEASALLRKVNPSLKSPFQHGAQDDYHASDNPGVRTGGNTGLPDRFIVFNLGQAAYLGNAQLVRDQVYQRYGLQWPYDEAGHHHHATRST